MVEHADLLPILEPPMAGLVRRVFLGQVLPLRSCFQYPQHSFEDVPVIPAGTTPAVRPSLHKMRRKKRPLFVRDEHEPYAHALC